MEKNNKILLRILAVFLVIFLLRISFSLTFFKEIVLSVSKYPLKIISLTFLPFKSFVSVSSSLRDTSNLKKENQSLKFRLMQLEDTESENKRLCALLALKQKSQFSVLAARVIAGDSSNFRKTFLIDKGKQSGIQSGNAVLVGEGVIGVVMEVGVSTSRIILISDPGFSIAAKDKRSRVSGIVSGSLEGICVFKYLSLDEDIRVGDKVVSRGGVSRFPSGIPLGEVISISKDNSGLSMFAILKPKVKLSLLEEVLVVIND